MILLSVPSRYVFVDGDTVVSEDDAGDEAEKILDVVHANELVSITLSKKQFSGWVRQYAKSLMAILEKELVAEQKMAEETPGYEPKVTRATIELFQKEFVIFVKGVTKDFDSYDFFLGKSGNIKGALAFARWEGAAASPTFFFIKTGFTLQKF